MISNKKDFLASIKSLITSKYPDIFKDSDVAEYLIEYVGRRKLNIMVNLFRNRLKIKTIIFKCKHNNGYFISNIKLHKLLEYYYDNFNKNIPLNS